jgi:hypothetical protein
VQFAAVATRCRALFACMNSIRCINCTLIFLNCNFCVQALWPRRLCAGERFSSLQPVQEERATATSRGSPRVNHIETMKKSNSKFLSLLDGRALHECRPPVVQAVANLALAAHISVTTKSPRHDEKNGQSSVQYQINDTMSCWHENTFRRTALVKANLAARSCCRHRPQRLKSLTVLIKLLQKNL